MKKPAVTNPSEPAFPAGLGSFLYLTAATTGAAIMIIEILGARMLAPYVGTSHFVWTAQIAVTMVALAAGYYAGGRLADASGGRLRWLYVSLLGAAVYLSGITLVIKPVAFWCLGFNLALGSLLASALLFFLPLAGLAMTGPFLVRSLTRTVAGVGGSMGRLTAISTLGSFVGTVLIGYVLIPFLPNSVTLLSTAAVLAILGLVYLAAFERRGGLALPVGLALLLAGLGGLGYHFDRRPPFKASTELHRSNSPFGLLQVAQKTSGGYRYYLNDYLVQNTYDPTNRQGLSTFTYLLHGLAHVYTPNLREALCIGLGIGLVPREFAREGIRTDVVEINPNVARVARDFFDCPLDQFRLVFGDGREFLNRTTNHYDTIILDAFLGDSSPVHLFSREAFEAMRQCLRPDGTIVINCFADFHPRRDYFGASLQKTLRSVFRSVRIHSTGSGNVYFVASNRAPLDPFKAPDFDAMHPAIRWQARSAYGSTLEANPDHGIVLTDDFNPVDFYDAANREQTRRALAQGIQAL